MVVPPERRYRTNHHVAIPAPAMIAVLRSASQKNAQRSRFPSAGVTSGPGVELPGGAAYGEENAGSDIAARRTAGAVLNP